MNFSDGIQILQWNCRGIRGKLPQLQAFANEYDVMCIQVSLLWAHNIMCIQESLLWPHNFFNINGFKTIRKDITVSNQQGICILVRDNLAFSTLNLNAFDHTTFEALGIVLHCDNEPIVIINIYRRPNQYTPLTAIDQLYSAMLNKYKKVIFSVISTRIIPGGVANTRTQQVES